MSTELAPVLADPHSYVLDVKRHAGGFVILSLWSVVRPSSPVGRTMVPCWTLVRAWRLEGDTVRFPPMDDVLSSVGKCLTSVLWSEPRLSLQDDA